MRVITTTLPRRSSMERWNYHSSFLLENILNLNYDEDYNCCVMISHCIYAPNIKRSSITRLLGGSHLVVHVHTTETFRLGGLDMKVPALSVVNANESRMKNSRHLQKFLDARLRKVTQQYTRIACVKRAAKTSCALIFV